MLAASIDVVQLDTTIDSVLGDRARRSMISDVSNCESSSSSTAKSYTCDDALVATANDSGLYDSVDGSFGQRSFLVVKSKLRAYFIEAMDLSIHEAFNSVDRDKDGYIDADELQKALKILRQNCSDDRVKQMISRIDADNGKVSFGTFTSMVSSAESQADISDEDSDMRATFRAFDADQDGFIGPDDIRRMMESLTHDDEVITDSDINAMIVEADRDGDGLINYAEFILLMQNRLATSSQIMLTETNQSDDQLSELREVFSLFDKDHDSNISMNEVQQVMTALGQNANLSRLAETFQLVDQDGNGLIDFNEFLKMMQYGSKLPVGGSELTEIRALFQAFDKDSSGYIDAAELGDTMRDLGMPITSEDVKEMLKVAGVQSKGRIYYEDFVKMMSDQIPDSKKILCNGSIECDLDAVSLTDHREQHESNVKVAFSMFDKDGDGVITCTELLDVMVSLGFDVNSHEVQNIIKKIDLDGNGKIEYSEFECWAKQHIGLLPDDKIMMKNNKSIAVDTGTSTSELAQLFKVFDKDNDGTISASDLRGTMKDLGLILSEEDISAMMKQAGLGIEGNIKIIDFCKIMGPLLGHIPSAQSLSQDLNCASISSSLDKKHEDADLRVLFSEFDSNCDSYLTMEQCHQIIVFLGYKNVSESFVRTKFHKLDNKKLGLNYAQLKQLLSDVVDKKSGSFSNFSASLRRRISHSASETKKNSTTKPTSTKSRPVSEIPNGPFYESTGSAPSGSQPRAPSTCITATIEIPMQTLPLGHDPDLTGIPTTSPPLPPLDCTTKSTECISNAEHTIFVKTVSSSFTKFGQSQLGYVTSAELVELLRFLHYDLHLPHIRELLILTAANPDGLLSLSELLSHLTIEEPDIIRRKHNSCPEPDAWKAFKAFDRDHNGYITLEELQQTMRELGMSLTMVETQEMLKRADSNQDGRIDYKEFIKMIYDNRLVKQAATLQQKLSSAASPTVSTPTSPLLYPAASHRKTSSSSLSVQSSSLLTASPLRRKSAQHRTCAEMNALCRIFQKLDKRELGRISLADAIGQVNSCGITCVNPPDDGSGTVDFEEFMSMMNETAN